tara:strand:- start:215 stop:643 length:429 start_codon:yes stop_codon:yes gene_type:complete
MYKKNKKILNKLFSDNKVILNDLYDIKQNFRDLLDIKSTLIYKDCDKLEVKIQSKINHFSLINLKNSKFEIKNILTGIDFRKSFRIFIKISDGILSNIKLKNSSYITIQLSTTNYNKSIIDIDNCKHIKFIDLNNIIIDQFK